MDFELAEQNFIRLERLRQRGEIDPADYRAQLGALRVVDDQGATWMVQEGSGRWHRWDGSQWAPATPPGRRGVISVPAAGPTSPPPPGPLPGSAQMPLPGGYTQQGGGQPQPQNVSQAQATGQVSQQAIPPQVMLQRKRPGCFSITLRMLAWALVWGGAAWAVHAFVEPTPAWAYVAVGLGALGTLILWVRLMTRHGRALRRLVKGGAA